MSAARSRGQFIASKPRSEVFAAVAVGASIVVGALLLIWLIRPGPVGVPGKGGLLSRQPRMTLLVVFTAAALGGWAAYIIRRRQDPPLGRRNALALGAVVLVALAVIAGIFWPGGVIRHWPKTPKISQTPSSTPSSVPSTPSTGTGSTTAKPGTTVTPTTSATSPTTKGG
jgi:hypothetical protein